MRANAQSITQSEIDRSAMLRRVAIVLESLPTNTAQKLLDSFEPRFAASLQRAIATLADVDPMEQKRAIEAFRVSLEAQPTTVPPRSHENHPASSIETSILKAQDLSFSANQSPLNQSPLAFLGNVPQQDLVKMLAVEHPQAIALVLTSIEPGIAAEVLSRLPDALRAPTITRIGRLGEMPTDAALELAEHFQAKLQERQTADHPTNGKRTLAAIMAAMPPSESQRMMNAHQTRVPQTAPPVTPSFEATSSFEAPPSPVATPVAFSVPVATLGPTPSPATPNGNHHSEAEATAESLATRLRVVREESDLSDLAKTNSELDSFSETADHIHSYPGRSQQVSSRSDEVHFDSTDEIHQYLQSLSPLELCQALGKVETHDVLLTLCGLPNVVAEAALKVLPKEHADGVRSKMAQLHQINLREIDDAKERVAIAAQRENLSPSQTDAVETHRPVPLAA